MVGELQTAVLMADLEPGQGMNELTGGLDLPEPATNAAAGWDGDWYALWGNGDQEVMVWRSVWDSEEDAEAFSRALRGREEARFGGAFEGETADDVALVTEGNVVRVVRTGAEVTYVLGPTLDLADRTLGAVRAG